MCSDLLVGKKKYNKNKNPPPPTKGNALFLGTNRAKRELKLEGKCGGLLELLSA